MPRLTISVCVGAYTSRDTARRRLRRSSGMRTAIIVVVMDNCIAAYCSRRKGVLVFIH